VSHLPYQPRSADLTKACINGHLELAEWLHTRFALLPLTKRQFSCFDLHPVFNKAGTYGFSGDEHYHHPFFMTCVSGHLDVAKWLHETFALTSHNVTANGSVTLHYCARNGELAVLQWLHVTFSFTIEDVMSSGAYGFARSCAYGHLATVQWLYTTFGITKAVFDTKHGAQALAFACEQGNDRQLKVLQMLHLVFGLTADDFRKSTWRGSNALQHARQHKLKHKLEIAKWLAATFGME